MAAQFAAVDEADVIKSRGKGGHKDAEGINSHEKMDHGCIATHYHQRCFSGVNTGNGLHLIKKIGKCRNGAAL